MTSSRMDPLAVVIGLVSLASCHPQHASAASEPESGGSCEERRANLISYLAKVPDRPVVSPMRTELTTSTLGRVPGPGVVLEISSELMVIDGEEVRERELTARISRFAQWIASAFVGGERGEAAASPSAGEPPVLYVATAPDLDVQTVRAFLVRVPEFVELRLLVRSPPSKTVEEHAGASAAARNLSSRILFEPNPSERKRLADEGYRAFADCAALTSAVSSVIAVDPRVRWPAVRAALAKTVPECECGTLDAASLRLIAGAEQRAGAASLGWIPLSFLRDERCDATMPLRAMKKLVRQLEEFDEEFSAGVDRDALRFGDVLENDRLRVYFCDALPGETLAAKARAHATIYFRTAGSDSCESWTFEPLALGTPMGTLRRREPRASLAFHYWHAAEELRIFGPVDPASPSKPTDSRQWSCDETFHLSGVDASSIATEAGRWFYSEAACARTRDELHGPGCFVAHIVPSVVGISTTPRSR